MALRYYSPYMPSWHGQGQHYLLHLPHVSGAKVANASGTPVRYTDVPCRRKLKVCRWGGRIFMPNSVKLDQLDTKMELKGRSRDAERQSGHLVSLCLSQFPCRSYI